MGFDTKYQETCISTQVNTSIKEFCAYTHLSNSSNGYINSGRIFKDTIILYNTHKETNEAIKLDKSNISKASKKSYKINTGYHWRKA